MLEQPENFLGAWWTDPKGTSPLPSSTKNAFDPRRVLNSTGCLACNPCFPLISCQAPAGRGQGQHQEMGAAEKPSPQAGSPPASPLSCSRRMGSRHLPGHAGVWGVGVRAQQDRVEPDPLGLLGETRDVSEE